MAGGRGEPTKNGLFKKMRSKQYSQGYSGLDQALAEALQSPNTDNR